MANTAFTHDPTITVPGSSTANAIVTWNGTTGKSFSNSTIIVGATTMGLAADTDLLTFGNGTLAITGAITGVTTITATTFAGTLSGNATGSAATLTNARAIGGVNFNGSAAIDLPGVNSAGDQNTSGTAAGLSTALVVASGGTNTTSYTKGDVLIASAGTTLTKLGIGSNTYVLTADSNEATGVKWAAAGGGQLVLIGTAVASGSSTLTITGLDSTYDTYLILLSDIQTNGNGDEVLLRLGDSGGIDSGASDYSYHTQDITTASASYSAFTSTGRSSILLGDVGNATGEGLGATLWLHQPGDGAVRPLISGTVVHHATTLDPSGGMVIGERKAVITTTQVQIALTTSTYEAGRLTVFGVAHA